MMLSPDISACAIPTTSTRQRAAAVAAGTRERNQIMQERRGHHAAMQPARWVFWREKNNIGGAAGLGHGRKQGAYANTPLANVNPNATANATTAPRHLRRRRNDIMNIY